MRHFKPPEANSDAESNASDSSNDSNDSNSLSEASVKTYDDSEDGSEDSGRNFGLKLIELKVNFVFDQTVLRFISVLIDLIKTSCVSVS